MSRCYIERYADMNVSMYSEQTHTHAGVNIENMTERTKRIFFIYKRNMLMLKLMCVCVSESMEFLHWIDKNVDQYFGFLINVLAANKRKSCRLSSSSQHHNQPTNEIISFANFVLSYIVWSHWMNSWIIIIILLWKSTLNSLIDTHTTNIRTHDETSNWTIPLFAWNRRKRVRKYKHLHLHFSNSIQWHIEMCYKILAIHIILNFIIFENEIRLTLCTSAVWIN